MFLLYKAKQLTSKLSWSLLIFSVLYISNGFSQSAPTYIDWVKTGQTYMQIKVAKDGVYRIPASIIALNFNNLSTLSVNGFQIFRRGKEVAILVNSGTDNLLNGNDYIDFVGQINDGESELEMYQKPLVAVNTLRSIYDDTAHYFLTHTPSLDGKRVVNNGLNNNSSIPFEPYAWRTAIKFYSKAYFKGKGIRNEITHSSYFTAGEGWVGSPYSSEFDGSGFANQYKNANGSSNYDGANNMKVDGIQNIYSAGPKPILELLEIGRVNFNHKVELLLSSNQVSIDTFRFSGVGAYTYKREFPLNLIENGALQFWAVSRLRSNLAIGYGKVKYPATLQMPNIFTSLAFELPANANNYSRLKLENVGSLPELYDISNPLVPIRIGVGFLGGSYIAGVENTVNSRRLIIQNQPFLVGNSTVKKINFTSFNPLLFDYVIVTHPKLRTPTQGYSDPVQAYADFRKSPEGGNYKVLVLEIDEIYQRFGYGDRIPLAIRNLGGLFVQSNAKLKTMFLIGKGYTVESRYSPTYWKENLVPTFGTPGSDNAYALGLGEPGRTMAFPVGRLAARSPEHVAIYLNKVKETEAFKYNDLWKKNIFHISGGKEVNEQSAFTNIMRNEVAAIASAKYFGAKIGHFNKSINRTVEYVNVKKVLNDGLSLLTLFGHSSASTSDVQIGYASDVTQGFNNVGKYPMVIINGCFAGNLYDGGISLNEDWIFAPNKGAVLFWATSDESFSGYLREHLTHFYNVAFADSTFFGKSFGEIQKETMKRYLKVLTSQPDLDSAFMQQFNLHGDPVIKVFGGYKPDYKTSNQEVFLTQTSPTANLPFLRVAAVVSNFGRFTNDSLDVSVRRRFSNGVSSSLSFRLKSISYKDTLYFDLPQTENFEYFGNNRIEVSVDFQNKESELDENNNIGVIEFFLPSTGILPLFPKNYSIVSSRNIKLIVQNSDFLAPGRRYIFEIDTSAYFNSRLFSRSEPILGGSLCSWEYNLPIARDSTVFFWRVKFADQTGPTDTTWYRQSFEYINGSPTGWAQSNFEQFSKSVDEGVAKDYQQRKWIFPQKSVRLEASISGGGKRSPNVYNLTLDGIPLLKAGVNTSDCYNRSFPVFCGILLDGCSLKPKFWNFINKTELDYLAGCGREPFSVNYFSYVYSNFASLKQNFSSYIELIAKEGDYVILFPVDSTRAPLSELMGTILPFVPLIGVDPLSLKDIKQGDPFIIIGQKTKLPSPGMAQVMLPDFNSSIKSTNQTITVSKTFSSSCSSGEITSTKIGPASAWQKVFNRFGNTDSPLTDEYYLELKGISLSGKDSILVKKIEQNPLDISYINADSFPYLQLKAYVLDTINNTPASIKRLMVTYEGVPEGVINTSVFGFDEYKKADRQEGDSIGYNFAYTNISNKVFRDSVKVQFTLNGNQTTIKNLGKLPPDSTVKFSFPKIGTLGKVGSNQLLAYVNPKIQPEEYYENNALNLNFKVLGDKIQPVLDVTFDGVKIMNGDFVSPTPAIAISLKDENKFLLKGDTNGVSLFLTRPCQGCMVERIPLNSPMVKVYPAGKDNLFRLEYKPDKLENGNYRIAVEGSDVKGNASGINNYQVDFQVLDQKTITNFFPYPNPFSTSCQWVFTLTGDFPDDFKIQIMTVTGKVVREIMKSELGPLRIGNNITQYRWDATDEFGDRLANGVYLYRVVMKDPSTFAQRETAADKTFTKGFGKLYIIR